MRFILYYTRDVNKGILDFSGPPGAFDGNECMGGTDNFH